MEWITPSRDISQRYTRKSSLPFDFQESARRKSSIKSVTSDAIDPYASPVSPPDSDKENAGTFVYSANQSKESYIQLEKPSLNIRDSNSGYENVVLRDGNHSTTKTQSPMKKTSLESVKSRPAIPKKEARPISMVELSLISRVDESITELAAAQEAILLSARKACVGENSPIRSKSKEKAYEAKQRVAALKASVADRKKVFEEPPSSILPSVKRSTQKLQIPSSTQTGTQNSVSRTEALFLGTAAATQRILARAAGLTADSNTTTNTTIGYPGINTTIGYTPSVSTTTGLAFSPRTCMEQLSMSHQRTKALSADLLQRLRCAAGGEAPLEQSAILTTLSDQSSKLEQEARELRQRIEKMQCELDGKSVLLTQEHASKATLTEEVEKLNDENDRLLELVEGAVQEKAMLEAQIATLIKEQEEAIEVARAEVLASIARELSAHLPFDLSRMGQNGDNLGPAIQNWCTRLKDAIAMSEMDLISIGLLGVVH
jgi:hypothetical protein